MSMEKLRAEFERRFGLPLVSNEDETEFKFPKGRHNGLSESFRRNWVTRHLKNYSVVLDGNVLKPFGTPEDVTVEEVDAWLDESNNEPDETSNVFTRGAPEAATWSQSLDNDNEDQS